MASEHSRPMATDTCSSVVYVSSTALIFPFMARLSWSTYSSLSGAHHFPSLKLTSTNFLYWKTQLFPFLRGHALMGFIDGTHPCPPSHIAVDDSSSPQPNPAHTEWVLQDQLLMSLLNSSLSEDVLSLVVGLTSSHQIWATLEAPLASPSNTRVLQLDMTLQQHRQEDDTVSVYLQKAKAIYDKLVAAGRPLSLADFNIYIFKGLRSEFKDLVTTVVASRAHLLFGASFCTS